MPPWIISALRLVATMGSGYVAGQAIEQGLGGTQEIAGFAGGRGAIPGAGIVGQIMPGRSTPGYIDHHGRWHSGYHRRRRRRALTASDRADIAFIAATISKTAAGSFASIIAAR